MLKKALALAALASGTAAFAATTGTLNLAGTVSSNISISVAAQAAASSLDLSTTQTNLLVAVVTENSNATNGYQIKAKSTNGSQIKHSTASDNVAYTMKYGTGGATTLTTTDQIVKTQATGGVYAVNSNVTISYTGASAGSIQSGSYSDVITFTIEAL